MAITKLPRAPRAAPRAIARTLLEEEEVSLLGELLTEIDGMDEEDEVDETGGLNELLEGDSNTVYLQMP
jgi:hypothetical protein